MVQTTKKLVVSSLLTLLSAGKILGLVPPATRNGFATRKLVLDIERRTSKRHGRALATKIFQRGNRRDNNDEYLSSMEREVVASARARMDVNRVARALEDDYALVSSDGGAGDRRRMPPETKALMASQWKVSLAAAIFTGVAIFAVLGSFFLSCVAAIAVFVVANQDPLNDDGLAGALARLVGRSTIQSVETATPKLRAMARAAITNEEEIKRLKSQMEELRQANEELLRWKERRIAVDRALPYFSSDQLKGMARRNKLPVGGNRTQLLMRLVEAGVIDL